MKDYARDRQEFEKLRIDNPDTISYWEKLKRDQELKDWGDKHGKKTDKTREMIVGTTQPPKAS